MTTLAESDAPALGSARRCARKIKIAENAIQRPTLAARALQAVIPLGDPGVERLAADGTASEPGCWTSCGELDGLERSLRAAKGAGRMKQFNERYWKSKFARFVRSYGV